MACLDENTTSELVEGRLGEARAKEIAAHLDSCPSCRELVTETVQSSMPAARPQLVLAAGTPIGRYVIVELVGVGAMGVVYAAWDPLLSRRVALKLLRADGEGGSSSNQRLLREAQAQARLQHPHVIAMYDVGTIGEQSFLAMELVPGGTLSEWLLEKPRRWDKVLPLFCDAGEGLAAAHAVGLVHRDFKPDNVLVGTDGRVRVTDFGLARDLKLSASPEPLPWTANRAGLARATAIAGTPVYMSPEQLRGEPADARSDQFSFCVALYEALYGERPFAGDDLPSLRAAILRGELRPHKPGRSRVPASVRRALVTGLKSEPSERHPSMEALLRELRKTRRFTPARATVALIVLGLLTTAAVRASRPVCTGAEAAWGELWSPAQEEAARAAFASASGGSAGLEFAQVDRALQTLHKAWTAMHTEACRATWVRNTQSPRLLDQRMQCLEDRRREASDLVQLFVQATPSLVHHAREAVDAFTPLSRCADARALADLAPLPEDAKARAAAQESKAFSAKAKALLDAHELAAAVEPADRAIEAARRSGHKSTLAVALYRRGDVDRRLGRGAQAAPYLHEAAINAEEGHDDGTLADCFILLSFVRGFMSSTPEEGELWARYAESVLVRMGGDNHREAERQRRLGQLYLNDERMAGVAREHFDRARELFMKEGAPEGMLVSLDAALATLKLQEGDSDGAIALFKETVAAEQRLNGADKLDNGLSNLGNALNDGGRPQEALPVLLEQLAIEERLHQPNYFTVHKLATTRHLLGQYEEALRVRTEALRLYRSEHPVDDGWAIEPLTGLGEDLLALDRAAEAVAPLERALKLLGDDLHGELAAHCQFALARALWGAGKERPRAVALAQAAQETFRGLDERHGSYYGNFRREADAFVAAHAALALSPSRSAGSR